MVPDKCELLKSLYDYKCSAAECLEFSAGDYFYLYQQDTEQPNWWQVITMKGQLGLIPCNFVCTEEVQADFYISFLNLATQYLCKKAGKTEDEQEALAKLTCKTQQMKQLFNCNSEPAERRESRATPRSPKQECGSKSSPIPVVEITAACGQVPQEQCGRRSYEPPISSCQHYSTPRPLSRGCSDVIFDFPIDDQCGQMPRESCGRRSYEPPIPACQRYGAPRPASRGCSDRSPPERISREPYERRPRAQEMRPACEKPKVERTRSPKFKPDRCDDQNPFSCCEYGLVVVLAMALLVAVSALTIAWVMFYREGYAWTSWKEEPERHFNLHPTLMIIGFITFSGIAILLFRICRRCRHVSVKLLHALFHVLAVPCIYFGYIATWDSHNLNEPPVPHFYSLHSWLGLATMGLFAFQYVCSFFAFLFLLLCNQCTSSFRAALVPVHVAVGVLTFVLAVCCCLTGITETAFFTLRAKYVVLSGEGIVMNSIGLILLVILALVVCILMPKTYSHGDRERTSC